MEQDASEFAGLVQDTGLNFRSRDQCCTAGTSDGPCYPNGRLAKNFNMGLSPFHSALRHVGIGPDKETTMMSNRLLGGVDEPIVGGTHL